MGSFLSPSILLSLVLMEGSRSATDIWMAHWVNTLRNDSSFVGLKFFDHWESFKSSDLLEGAEDWSLISYYLEVYGLIALANCTVTLARAFLFAYGGLCAARVVHQKLAQSLIQGNLTFFNVTPLGRILNRISADVFTVDDSLPFIMNIFMANLVGVVCPIIVCAYAVPWILLGEF